MNDTKELLLKNVEIFPYLFWDLIPLIGDFNKKNPEKIEKEESGYFTSLANALLLALE